MEMCDKISPKNQWYFYLIRRFYASSNFTWESQKTGFHSKITAKTKRKGHINKRALNI
jgi:hypothetical protein